VSETGTTQSTPSVVRAAVVVEGGLALAAIVLGWLVGQPPLAAIDWTVSGALWGLAGAVPLFAALVAMTHWPIGPLADLEHFVRHSLVPWFRSATLFELAVICLLAGFGEELLFRGVIQAALERATGSPWLALAVAGVLFGLAHPITRTYAVVAGVIGVYLGWLLVASGNLLVPACAHAVYDFAALAYMLRTSGADETSEAAAGAQDEWSI
jgi:membrane protease YdiL (CAAX protease family)